MPMAGRDYDVTAHITLDQAYHGAQIDLNLSVPDYDGAGRLQRADRSLHVRIPAGAIEGQRLRLRAQGGKGFNGGPAGDLYLNLALRPDPLFRAAGRDLYLDLALAPWEAALGASVDIPAPGGTVSLKIPPATSAGKTMRLAGRGLPNPHGSAGDLFAVIQITLPAQLSEQQKKLFEQLADISTFNPRSHFTLEKDHAD